MNLNGKKPKRIVLLGAQAAVGQNIETQAKNLIGSSNVSRLAGADRTATAREITKEWVRVNSSPRVAYITKNAGSGSPDAVAGSVLRDGPILTYTSDSTAAQLKEAVAELNVSKVVALGGNGAVPDDVFLTVADGKASSRLAGSDRYETAFAIAQTIKAQKASTTVYLASGTALKAASTGVAPKPEPTNKPKPGEPGFYTIVDKQLPYTQTKIPKGTCNVPDEVRVMYGIPSTLQCFGGFFTEGWSYDGNGNQIYKEHIHYNFWGNDCQNYFPDKKMYENIKRQPNTPPVMGFESYLVIHPGCLYGNPYLHPDLT